MDRQTRIGFDERDEATRRLQDHLAAGRLEVEEFEERMGRALQARTIGDLESLFSDLPDRDWLLSLSSTVVPAVRGTRDQQDTRTWVTRSVVAPGRAGMWPFLLALVPLIPMWLFGIRMPFVPVLLLLLVVVPIGAGFGSGLNERRREITYVRGDIESEVQALLGVGCRLEAIKRFREATGTNLVTAKASVEAIGRKALPR